MSMAREFLLALKAVFGSAGQSDVTVAAAGIGKLLVAGPATLNSLFVIATATVGGTVQYIDASATGIGGAVRWQTPVIPNTGLWGPGLPLQFTSGLVMSYTATGAATVAINSYFDARPA